MSVIAGIVCHKGFNSSHKAIIDKLTLHFEQFPTEQVKQSRSPQHNVFNFDFDAYQQPAWIEHALRFATCIGHPLLTADRSDDLISLSEHADLEQTLGETEGAFCYTSFNQATGTLTLATDPLGLRPFYYLCIDDAIIFSTQLKVLRQLDIGLTANLDGVTEFATLGYFLADHTPYNEVHCARPGQLLTYQNGIATIETYFDWERFAHQQYPTQFALELMNDAFKHTCQKYRGNDSHVMTALSEGLGSRVIATEHQRAKCELTALHFHSKKIKQQNGAQSYARAQGIPCHIVGSTDSGKLSTEQKLGIHWREANHQSYAQTSRPQLAWSGAGASACIGMNDFSEALYTAAQSGDAEALVDTYLSQKYAYLPKSVVVGAEALQDRLKENLMAAFEPYKSLPLEKAFQLFLFLNDQHHRLAIPAEEIDEYQMESCVPMYSWKVLQYPLSQPLSELRNHKFLLSWLEYAYPQTLHHSWGYHGEHNPLSTMNAANGQKECSKLLRRADIAKIWQQTMGYKQHEQLNKTTFSLHCLLHVLGLKNATAQIRLAKRLTAW